MKHLALSILSFTLLVASDKTPSIIRFTDLNEFKKRNVTERFKRYSDRLGLERVGKFGPSEKVSQDDFKKLRLSSKRPNNKRATENRSDVQSLARERDISIQTPSISSVDQDLFGRWNLESEERGAFITLNSSVLIPDLEQFLRISPTDDHLSIASNPYSGDKQLQYMFAADYMRYGYIIISNVPYWAEIEDGQVVYELVFYYEDNSIESPEDYLDYITNVNLRHPTAGELWVWYPDEDDSWSYAIPFGGGFTPEGSQEFHAGVLSLIFDGIGNLTVTDLFDPTSPETLEYSVDDDGTVTIEEGPLTMVNPDGTVIAFMDSEDTGEGMIGLGFELATAANLASFQGLYYGVGIGEDGSVILGEWYDYPVVNSFVFNFDGAGNYTVQDLDDDGSEPDTGTYTVDENGMLVLDELFLGFLSADSAYGIMYADTLNVVDLLLKGGTDKNVEGLEGDFSFGEFAVHAGVDGLDFYMDYSFATGELNFDGAGNYTVSVYEESETGTYDVSESGILTIDDEQFGFVGSGDDVILFASYDEDGMSIEGFAGMAIKKSSGLTEASLAGNYGAAFIEYSSDTDPIYVEDHVTIDFLGISDSVATATLVSTKYENGELIDADIRFPVPMDVTVTNLGIEGEGYDYLGNEDHVYIEFHGSLGYDKVMLPSGVELPLPTLGDIFDTGNEDFTLHLEFQKDNLGREIEEYSYTDDDGETWGWVDTTNFAWSANNDMLKVIMHTWEWDEETGEEYESYEEMVSPYTVGDNSLTLGGEFEPCDYWEEEDWWSSWEECIEYEFPILNLAFTFLSEGIIDDYYVLEKETFNYKGAVPAKPTLISTLPMVKNMPNIFMEDMEVSGNRLYGGGHAYFGDAWDSYLRILDISNPLDPKELHFSRPGADDSGAFDMVVKGNTVILNSQYGPDFYDVSGDKISDVKGTRLNFDGTEDYVSTGESLLNNLTSFTMAGWVTPEKSGDRVGFFGQNNLIELGFNNDYVAGSDKISGWTAAGGEVNWTFTSTTFPFNHKYHVVFVGSGTDLKIYINGELKVTGGSSTSSYGTSDYDFNIGGGGVWDATGNWFDGFIYETALWNIALPANEITALYNSGTELSAASNSGNYVSSTNLIAYWKFNAGSGSSVTDLSGNGKTATIHNANWHSTDVFSVQDTKCCVGQEMALQGNNLYIPRWYTDPALRIIDVTVPSQPSLVSEVPLSDLNSNTWSSDGSSIDPFFDDIKANSSYVFVLDQNAGDGTDTCWEGEDAGDVHSVVRIHSTTSPYSQVALLNVKDADMIEVDAKYIYTTSCGNFYVYDYSDLNDIKQVAMLSEWSAGEETSYEWTFFESYNGEIEKIGNYIYIARGGNDDWKHLGVNVIDVSDPTNPVHLANLPDDIFTEEYDGGYVYPARSVAMTENGYLLAAQQSSESASGDLYVYATNFAPQPFSLIFPPDGMRIDIDSENAWKDSIIFTWESTVDLEGSSMMYQHEVTGDLDNFFLISGNMTENRWTIPLHHVKHYMDQAGISVANGTWNIWATDGVSNVWSANGPFELTIDAAGLSVEKGNLIPDQFALHSNYPNPFNPTTRIRYDLPEDGAVIMTVFDLAGRKIRELVNRNQSAGFHFTVWDGRNDAGQSVSTGLYIYQIRAGSFVESQKMVLMK